MRIYVGNLSYEVTEEELRADFASFGKVESIAIPTDKSSGFTAVFVGLNSYRFRLFWKGGIYSYSNRQIQR